MNSVSVPALAALARDRGLRRFTVVLQGNALAPRFHDGELLVVDTIALAAPGDAVIASLPCCRSVAMLLNADGDLVDRTGGYVARGAYEVVGVIKET